MNYNNEVDINKVYKQNDVVVFDNGVVCGKGIVCGLSTMPLPIIGQSYIIAPIEFISYKKDKSTDEIKKYSAPLPNEIYPYTHIVMFGMNIKGLLKDFTSENTGGRRKRKSRMHGNIKMEVTP